MTARTHVLLWADSTAAYVEAIKDAGLADRVVVDTLPRKEKPTAEQMARTEALMSYGAPPGSSCCPISAVPIRSVTRSSRACSSKTWAASWRASR